MKELKSLFLASAVASTLPLAAQKSKTPIADTNKPNVIWVFGDQHRAMAMGYMGDPNARTPNLDRISAEGVTFTNSYSGCPWSTPFRGSLLTGLYPNKAVYKSPQHLDASLPLVTDVFNENGYTTAMIGKWHLFGGSGKSFVPREERGRFDVWYCYENNNAQYNCWVHGHDIWGRADTIAAAEKLQKYETDALIDKAIEFLRRRPKERPFFLVVSVQPPHNPFVAPPEFMTHFNKDSLVLRVNVPPVERLEAEARKNLAGYYAQIENLDYNIGRLFDAMKELNLLDNTHFAYFADHGDCHQSHGYERKSSPWEEATRIPTLFRPAGGTKQMANFTEAMFQTIDFAPTTLGLCSIAAPQWMDGYDFSNYILPNHKSSSSRPEPDAVLLQHIYPKGFDCLDRPWRGIVTKDGWKYVVIDEVPIMLFNLREDPYELNNMVYNVADKKMPKLRTELAARLQAMLDAAGDDFKVSDGSSK